jgi:hypothetical protein
MEGVLDIAEINLKLSSLAWASSNGGRSGEAIRVFPAAKPEAEVIGAFDRFAGDAQRFEMVWQHGEVSVRPWLPEAGQAARASFGSADNEDNIELPKAA